MSYPINYPTPQGANVQIFYGSASASSVVTEKDWVKPQGASFVWFTLIGAGGDGDGANGGGSGAITNFMCPAFLIPDYLRVSVTNNAAGSTQIRYQQKDGTGYLLLSAASGSVGAAAGAAMSANFFTAMGFFQAIGGQNGVSNAPGASGTTFLGGGGGSGGVSAANYGYSAGPSATNRSGFFQMQPIIVGCGGMGGAATGTGNGGIGCGGGVDSGKGGSGLVVIITW